MGAPAHFNSDAMETSTPDGTVKYKHIMYIDNGQVSTHAHSIETQYIQCPAACRFYKYNVYVLGTDGEPVLQHTTDFGNKVSISEHRDFRVTVSFTSNDNICYKVNCKLTVLIVYNPSPGHRELSSLRFSKQR